MLTFPTLAEQAISQFQSSTKTVSFSAICPELGGEKVSDHPIIWHFPDDTTLVITGRGASHRFEALLP